MPGFKVVLTQNTDADDADVLDLENKGCYKENL